MEILIFIYWHGFSYIGMKEFFYKFLPDFARFCPILPDFSVFHRWGRGEGVQSILGALAREFEGCERIMVWGFDGACRRGV